MTAPVPRKGLAIASLALGLVGLVTAGGCGVLSAAGLVLGVAGLVRARRDPAVDGGRDVAWAGILMNALALLTIGPVLVLAVLLNKAGALPTGKDDLPDPVPPPTLAAEVEPAPPPPPAPSATPAEEAPAPEATPSAEATPAETPTPRTRPRPAAPSPRPAAARSESVPEARPPVQPVRVGGDIREPTKLRNVSPVYPAVARSARVQGIVILEATISPEGTVSDVRVLRSVPLLDAAAVEAVRQWEYTPTLLNGVPVPVIMTVTVNFKMN